MPRYSKEKRCVSIICDPETYERFYRLKKIVNRNRGMKQDNREFLQYLLDVLESFLRSGAVSY